MHHAYYYTYINCYSFCLIFIFDIFLYYIFVTTLYQRLFLCCQLVTKNHNQRSYLLLNNKLKLNVFIMCSILISLYCAYVLILKSFNGFLTEQSSASENPVIWMFTTSRKFQINDKIFITIPISILKQGHLIS